MKPVDIKVDAPSNNRFVGKTRRTMNAISHEHRLVLCL